MHSEQRLIVSLELVTMFLIACQSHQSKIDALQKEYDRLSAEMQQDCSAEYMKVPPTLSPKCTEEKKKLRRRWKRLQAERPNSEQVKENIMRNRCALDDSCPHADCSFQLARAASLAPASSMIRRSLLMPCNKSKKRNSFTQPRFKPSKR